MGLNYSDLHFGQTVLLRTLNSTEHYLGSNASLRELKGNPVTIYEFDNWDGNWIKIFHPINGKNHTIHIDDICLFKEPDDELKIINMEQGEKVTFDEEELFL